MNKHVLKKIKKSLIEINKKQISKICNEHGLKYLIIFGSQLTSYIHKKSDLDIGFVSKKKLNINQIDKLFMQLSLLFAENIDLVDLHDVSYLMHMEIFKNYYLLYENQLGKCLEWLSFAYINYHDFKKYYQQQKEINLKNI